MQTIFSVRAAGAKGMTGLVAAGLIAGALAGLAGDASAQQTQAAYRSVKSEWTKARAAGGYGNPVTEIPAGMVEAIGDAATTMVGRTPTPKPAAPAPAATK